MFNKTNNKPRYCNWCGIEILDGSMASICWECLEEEGSEEDDYEDDE